MVNIDLVADSNLNKGDLVKITSTGVDKINTQESTYFTDWVVQPENIIDNITVDSRFLDYAIDNDGNIFGLSLSNNFVGYQPSENFEGTLLNNKASLFVNLLEPNFIDISETGEPIIFESSDSKQSGPISLGFSILYYNKTYDSFYVANPGYISFEKQITYNIARPGPSLFVPSAAVFGFFTDLGYTKSEDPNSGWFYQNLEINNQNIMIIQWNKLLVDQRIGASSENITFQIKIFESGRIETHLYEVPVVSESQIGSISPTKGKGINFLPSDIRPTDVINSNNQLAFLIYSNDDDIIISTVPYVFAASDYFIIKMDKFGQIMKTKLIWNEISSWSKHNNLKIDNQNNIYISANKIFNDVTFAINNDFGPSTSAQEEAIVIKKYDSELNLIWIASADRDNTNYLPSGQFGTREHLKIHKMDIDNNNDIYVTGVFVGQIKFNSTLILESKNWDCYSIFIAKLSSNGEWVWSNMIDPIIPYTRRQNGLLGTGIGLQSSEINSHFVNDISISDQLNQVAICGSLYPKRGDLFGYVATELEWDNFEDISETGIPILVNARGEKNIDIPFDFPFYEDNFDNIWINSNGNISMVSSFDSNWQNTNIIRPNTLPEIPFSQNQIRMSTPPGMISVLPVLEISVQPHYPSVQMNIAPNLINYNFEDITETGEEIKLYDPESNLFLDDVGVINSFAIIQLPFEVNFYNYNSNEVILYNWGTLRLNNDPELSSFFSNIPVAYSVRWGSQEAGYNFPYALPQLTDSEGQSFKSPGSNMIYGFSNNWHYKQPVTHIENNGEIEYNFEDISTTGNIANTAGVWASSNTQFSASSLGPFNIGFNFEFFGETYNEFFISRDGFISFNPTECNAPSSGGLPAVDDLYSSDSYPQYRIYDEDSEIIKFISVPREVPKNMIAGYWPRQGFELFDFARESISVDYNFIDISETGNTITFSEEGISTVPIGFNFIQDITTGNLYGVEDNENIEFSQKTWNDIIISKNGLCAFWDEDQYLKQKDILNFSFLSEPVFIPDPSIPNYAIFAPLWTELDLESGGEVFYKTIDTDQNNKCFIVQWNEVPHKIGNFNVTFQMKIFEETESVEQIEYAEEIFLPENSYLFNTIRGRCEVHIKTGIPDPNIHKVCGSNSTFVDLSYAGGDIFTPKIIPDEIAFTLNRASLNPIRFQVLGESPNRRLIIQWTNMKHQWYPWNTINSQFTFSTFQIKLFESSNKIESHVKLGNVLFDEEPNVIGMQNKDGTIGSTSHLDVMPIQEKAFDITESISLNENKEGSIHYKIFDDYAVFQWTNVSHRGRYGYSTFQIKLFSNDHLSFQNKIQVHIKEIDQNNNQYHLIGYQNIFGTDGLITHDSRVPPNNETAFSLNDAVNEAVDSSVKYQMFGEEPNRYIIVQWSDITVDTIKWAGGGLGAPVSDIGGKSFFSPSTFQAKLFENGDIEFHYLKIGQYISTYSGIQNLDYSDGFVLFNNQVDQEFLYTTPTERKAFKITRNLSEEDNIILPTFPNKNINQKFTIGENTLIRDSEFCGIGYIASLNKQTGEWLWAKGLTGQSSITSIINDSETFKVIGMGFDDILFGDQMILDKSNIPEYFPATNQNIYFQDQLGFTRRSANFIINVDQNGELINSDILQNLENSVITLPTVLELQNNQIVISSNHTCKGTPGSLICSNNSGQGLFVFNNDLNLDSTILSNCFTNSNTSQFSNYTSHIRSSKNDNSILLYSAYAFTLENLLDLDGISLNKTNGSTFYIAKISQNIINIFEDNYPTLIGYVNNQNVSKGDIVNVNFNATLINCENLNLNQGENYSINNGKLVIFDKEINNQYIATAISNNLLLLTSNLYDFNNNNIPTNLILQNESWNVGDPVLFDTKNLEFTLLSVEALLNIPKEISELNILYKITKIIMISDNISEFGFNLSVKADDNDIPTQLKLFQDNLRFNQTNITSDGEFTICTLIGGPVITKNIYIRIIGANLDATELNLGNTDNIETQNVNFIRNPDDGLLSIDNLNPPVISGNFILRAELELYTDNQINQITPNFEDITLMNGSVDISNSFNDNEVIWGPFIYSSHIDLPFSFNFFGQIFNFIKISGNGALAFDDNDDVTHSTQSSIQSPELPGIQGNNYLNEQFNTSEIRQIRCLHQDVTIYSNQLTGELIPGASVKYIHLDSSTPNERFIIQWTNVINNSIENKCTFQTKFYANGRLETHILEDNITFTRRIIGIFVSEDNPLNKTTNEFGDISINTPSAFRIPTS